MWRHLLSSDEEGEAEIEPDIVEDEAEPCSPQEPHRQVPPFNF